MINVIKALGMSTKWKWNNIWGYAEQSMNHN